MPRTRPIEADAAAESWQGQYDFTGDGVRDRIEVSYSGGAHCCYTLAMVDGRSGAREALPFELDGGYPRGLDLSQPERFAVVAAAESAESAEAAAASASAKAPPRLELEIATYNGEPEALPADGFGLGVKSHRIAVSFVRGIEIENLGWRCERALMVIQRRSWSAWEGLAADCELGAVLAALDAVPAAARPGTLGAAQRPVTVHRAERVEDGVALVAYTERNTTAANASPPSGLAKPRLLRLDLLSPELAAASMAAWSASAPEVSGTWRYWRNGLAVTVPRKSSAPTVLTLVAAGELQGFLRELASP